MAEMEAKRAKVEGTPDDDGGWRTSCGAAAERKGEREEMQDMHVCIVSRPRQGRGSTPHA